MNDTIAAGARARGISVDQLRSEASNRLLERMSPKARAATLAREARRAGPKSAVESRAKDGLVRLTSGASRGPAAPVVIASKTAASNEAALTVSFKRLGLNESAAKVAALGRGARPASAGLVEPFARGRLREAAVTKHEDPAGSFKGGAFGRGDYAFAPDAEDPETWQLLLTLTPGGTADADSVQAAVGAIDPATMGQNVVIPDDQMAGVVSKLAKAWKDSGLPTDEMPEVLSQEAARRAFRRLGITNEAGLRAAVRGRGGRN